MKESIDAMKDVEAARRLGISAHTLRQWRLNGKGPEFVKMGRNIRYMPETLEAYVKSNTVNPAEQNTA